MKFHTVLQSHAEHAVYVANLIAVWNTIEDLLTQVLSLILRCSTEKSNAILISITGNRAKLGVVRAVAKIGIIEPDKLDEFQRLMNKLVKQLDYRNKLAHGLFGTDDKGRVNLINRRYDLHEDQQGATVLNVEELEAHWVTASENFNEIIRIHNEITQSYLEKGEDLSFLSEKFQTWLRDVE